MQYILYISICYPHPQALEEIFKASLANPDTSDTATVNPDLSTVRPLIQDTAAKMWLTYFDNEKRCVYGASEKMKNQLHTVCSLFEIELISFFQEIIEGSVCIVSEMNMKNQLHAVC